MVGWGLSEFHRRKLCQCSQRFLEGRCWQLLRLCSHITDSVWVMLCIHPFMLLTLPKSLLCTRDQHHALYKRVDSRSSCCLCGFGQHRLSIRFLSCKVGQSSLYIRKPSRVSLVFAQTLYVLASWYCNKAPEAVNIRNKGLFGCVASEVLWLPGYRHHGRNIQ